jgi:hypothetical protein
MDELCTKGGFFGAKHADLAAFSTLDSGIQFSR